MYGALECWVFGSNGTENRLNGTGSLTSHATDLGEPLYRAGMNAEGLSYLLH
jgi:hypothetical protein